MLPMLCTFDSDSRHKVRIRSPCLCVQQFAAALAGGGGARPETHGSDGVEELCSGLLEGLMCLAFMFP